MKTKNIVQLLSSSRLELLEDFPELRELSGTVQNNTWHKNDDILNHTLTVFSKLKENLQLDFVKSKNIKLDLNHHMNERVSSLTRKETLIVATLFHDIAKPETLEGNSENAMCPNHELRGSEKAFLILKDYINDEKDLNRVVKIIKYHGLPHQLLSERGKIESNIESLQKEYSDIYVELLLLALSDTEGCQLNELIPEEFVFRINTYHDLLNDFE